MSDDDFGFELEPYNNQAQRGLSGTAGTYGRVQVFYVKPVRAQHGAVFRTELVSEHLPEAKLSGPGMGGQPYLGRGAVLSVGGVTGELVHNSLGIRRAARAVRIRLADRRYTYASTGSFAFELRREGARVAFANGRSVKMLGPRRRGTAHGAVDETDLALALVLEMVDASFLSVGGILTTGPFRLLNPQSDGGGE